MLDTVVFDDPKAIAFFTNEMLLVKLNAELDTLTKQRYNIMGYPTSVLVDKEGNEIDRFVGFGETDEYIGTFRNYARGIGTLDDMAARFEVNQNRDSAFAIAEKYKYRGAVAEADQWYDRVVAMGAPTDSLAGEARVAQADAHLRAKDFAPALAMFEQIRADFAGTRFAEDAEIYRAIAFGRQNDTAQAIAAFSEFLDHWPESEAADYAKEQLRKLKGEEPSE